LSGWNLDAVGILPVADQFSLLGKLGFAGLRTSGTLVGGAAGNVVVPGSATKTALTYGIGAKYDFTKSIFGRFDIDSYQTGNPVASSRSTVWMFDVGYNF
jgi:opacity protein-like surface antigen